METAHAAALKVIRQSIGMFREALVGLPGEAMDWVPVAGTNSLAVLVTHNCSSLRFFAGCGAGRVSSLQAYREGARAGAFQARGMGVANALAALDELEGGMVELLGAATAADLEAAITWPEDPAMAMTGAEALIRAVAHFREHVGQAQLMRDLWLASHPA